MEGKEENKKKGIMGTVGVHILLLLAFFLMKLYAPAMEDEQGGILISFGDTEAGMGDVQTESETTTEEIQEASDEELSEPQESQPEEAEAEPELTQDIEEAPVVKKEEPRKETPVKKEEEKPKEEVKVPEKPKVNTKALYPGSKNNQQSSGSGQGNTNTKGDQGSPDGSTNSTSATGSGKGDSGVSFNLSGRSMVQSPKIDDRSQETGKVVIDITVDKYGNVNNASGPGRGSTTTSANLYKKAREAALRAKFNPSPSGVEEQKGTITFVFILE
ncbi:MAG: TonB family protein [Bacteroidia bacterium]|nr:TonB family protein [Bacteroidia bacterium]